MPVSLRSRQGIFSIITVGAPIMATATIRSSSVRSEASIIVTGPYVRIGGLRHQPTDVGIATATGAEHRRAERHVVELLGLNHRISCSR